MTMLEKSANNLSFDQHDNKDSTADRSLLEKSGKEPAVVMRAKTKKRNTTGPLHQSCYVRNENALSMLQSNIATGNDPISGASIRKQKNKIQNLAALLGDKSAFDQAFSNSMIVQPARKAEGNNMLGDKVNALLEASRTFMIGDREYHFDEKESIFFLEGPINPRNYHNTPEGCHTCQDKWQKATDLQGSHCHFCGKSNCKKCMMKTRKFVQRRKPNGDLSKSRRDVPERGSICKLCDRKFLIKEMVHGSLDEITSHNDTLNQALAEQEVHKKAIQDVTEKHRLESTNQKHQIATLKNTISKLKEEVEESISSNEHFRTEIEHGTKKEKLIQEKLDALKTHVEQLEETVS